MSVYLNYKFYLSSLLRRTLSLCSASQSLLAAVFCPTFIPMVWFAYTSVNILRRKAAHSVRLLSFCFSLESWPLKSCLSQTPVFVFPAPLPSNTYLPLTFSTSLSLLLMNWEMVGGKQCKMLGLSESVSLFPRILAIQIPLWEFYFSVCLFSF